MDMKQKMTLTKELIEMQKSCSEIKMTFGAVIDGRCTQAVAIFECPSCVVRHLVELGYSLSLNQGCLFVDLI